MTLALSRRPRLLPPGLAGNDDSDAANGVGAPVASAAIRLASAVRNPGFRLRLATEPPQVTHAPGHVAPFSVAALATPPPASDSS